MIIRAACTLLALCTIFGTEAKKSKEEKELERSVVVYLSDGTVLTGMIDSWWTATGKNFNKRFSMVDDDGVRHKVNVENIDSLCLPNADDPRRRLWRPMLVIKPKIGNRNNMERWLAAAGESSEHARIFYPEFYAQVGTGGGGWRSYLVRLPSLCIGGDSIVCPFYYYYGGNLNLKVSKARFDEIDPGLYDFLNNYFKTDKKAKKGLGDNPAIMLEAYEAFLRSKSNP